MKKASEKVFLEGAIQVAATIGLENLRTKHVAEFAGFSEATLFRTFPTKEELLKSAFLKVDREIADLLLHSDYVKSPDGIPFDLAAFIVWHGVYRYLIEHPDRLSFLIQYRHSAYYTDEIRKRRAAYNGDLKKVYEMLEQEFGTAEGLERDFLLSYIFEMTLCFADRVINGRMKDVRENEHRIWTAIATSCREMVRLRS